MTERKRKKFDISPILVELEKCKRLDSDGKIFFEGWPIVELYPTLEQAIDFPASLPETERWRIMREALRAAAANRPLRTQVFLGEISRLTHSFANTQPKPFVLASSISLSSIGEDISYSSRRRLDCFFINAAATILT